MNGGNAVITPENWFNYLQTRGGYQQADFNEILRRGEQIPADFQLDAPRRARLIKFLRATKRGATFAEVKNAHVRIIHI